MIINYPTEISGLNDFQTKALINQCSEIVDKYNVGFDYDGLYLSFLIYPLNISLNIEFYGIFQDFEGGYIDNYFQWLSAYVEEVGNRLNKGGDIIPEYHIDFTLHSADVEDFDFLTWGLLNGNIDNIYKEENEY